MFKTLTCKTCWNKVQFGSCCCRANTSCEAKQIPNDFQKHHSHRQRPKTHSRKMLFSMKTFSTVNETCPDMMASCSFPENTKNNDLYLVRRRDLVKTKSHHISQLFVCKFQSKMQHAFQSKHSHSTPGISIYFHTPSCCDVARIHWPCSMYQLVQKVHLKGYSIQTVASKIHMKYCWIQSDCQPDPVPVAVNSKNLVIDSATCSDCIELYHLELHCISKKITPAKPEVQNFRLT